jgi:predicted nucleic acid-binding protein
MIYLDTSALVKLVIEEPVVPLTGLVVETAETLGPLTLRSLDALHLASAFALGDTLTGFVSYDKRLRDAAALADLPVMCPGMA